MDLFTVYILGIVAVAYSFDFINGFHDSANSVATVISTKVLSPVAACQWWRSSILSHSRYSG